MLTVDPASAAPVYEQLRDQVLRLAVGGRLLPGQRLPTIRQLAADLTVAKGTIERAYELLERDGIILRRGASGSFVASPIPATSSDDAHEKLRSDVRRLALAARQLGLREDDVIATVKDAFERLPEI